MRTRIIRVFLMVAGLLTLLGGPATADDSGPHGIRGAFLDFLKDPFYFSEEESVRFIADGLLVVQDGKIKDFGPYQDLAARYANLPITAYRDKLMMPGFIDTHVHYVQSRITGAFGKHKPEWLHDYIFPEEIRCRDPKYAREVARFYLDEMLRVGTTTMQTFTTPFPDSVDVFFEEASKRNMRVIAGLTGVDRPGEGPEGYADTASSFYENSKALYDRWHGKGRNLYAVSPRYAPGCTDELLARAGELYKNLPGVYLNTHIAEPISDSALVKKLFPDSTDYLNVFERHGLIGPRSTFGHAIWLSDSEFERVAKTGSGLSFCPSSNLFLGSGLFKIAKAKSTATPTRVSLGTDMAGGNYFSHLKVLNDAYKVCILQDYRLSAFKGFYLATRGGAEALYLDDKLGSFDPGKEADFVVWDLMATPELAARNRTAEIRSLGDLENKAFGLMVLGDDRAVTATYVAGKRLYERSK